MYIRSSYFPFLEVSSRWNCWIVGLFFFISGYGLVYSFMAKKETYLQSFFKKRLSKLLIPALIAIGISLLLDTIENKVSLLRYYSTFLQGMFFFPAGWFVQTICLYYIAFYLCFSKYEKKRACFLLLIFSFLFIGFAKSVGWMGYIWSPVLAFNTGTFLALYEEKVKRLYLQNTNLIAVYNLLLLCLLCFIYYSSPNALPLSITNIIYPLLLIPPIFSTGNIINGKITKFLGSMSYEIYLIHFIVLEHYCYWQGSAELWFFFSLSLILVMAWLLHKVDSFIFIKL